MDLLILALVAAFVVIFTFFAFARRYKRCPSDKILVVYGKIAGGGRGGLSAKCYHGGAAFVWPLIQAYRFLDLTPMTIDIKLEKALSKQNIRVNTPSTFTVGISTEPGVMENAAERLLDLDMKRISELARDIIFGQMRVALATMPIEEINADRDKLIENITSGVEVELKKVGLRLINVNIQDITDESGYIDALGQEAAARAINEAKVKVALKERDGDIGSADADRDKRVRVAEAQATAVEGENESAIKIAQSNAKRREREAEAERVATAAEKVTTAQALEESYKAEEAAERSRAKREEATQAANVLVPAEIRKREVEVLAEAEAERVRRTRKGEADGLYSVMEAEARGLRAILSQKGEGFAAIVQAARGKPELASLLLVTEQLPKLIEEQVKAISNLKIDSVTVWEGGRGNGEKTATADFVSGLVGSLPPLHELTKNVGVKLPAYLGSMEEEGEAQQGSDEDHDPDPGAAPAPGPPRSSSGPSGGVSGGAKGQAGKYGQSARAGAKGSGTLTGYGGEGGEAPPPPLVENSDALLGSDAGALATLAPFEPLDPSTEDIAGKAARPTPPGDTESGSGGQAGEEGASGEHRTQLRQWLEEHPELLRSADSNLDGKLDAGELDAVLDTAFAWAEKARATGKGVWYYAREGRWKGPESWRSLRRLAGDNPDLPVSIQGAKRWLPLGAVEKALRTGRDGPRSQDKARGSGGGKG